MSVKKPFIACVAPVGDRCGEGPVWHAGEQALYWADINRFLIQRFDARERAVKFWYFEEPVTAIALTNQTDILAVALGSRLILWNSSTDQRREFGFSLNKWPAVRFNDGRPDPRGSLWLGTMRNNVNADGSSAEAGGLDGILFRVDPNGHVSEWKRDIGISNTVAWSPDRTRFYFADSLANRIWVYSYDQATGAIGEERIFFDGFDRGLPDGSAVDREGYLWNCRYGGNCVVRVSPGGSLERIIEMPVKNITSCTFGGPDYKTLYVTTASSQERLSGGLFALQMDVPGQPENRFAIE